MGAQIIGSVYNAKQLTKDIWKDLMASLAGVGFITILMDVGIWIGLLKLTLVTGNPLISQILGVFLYSLTPLVAEAFDKLVIKRLLISLDGGSFMPATLDLFLKDLKGTYLSGRISSGGSIMNNIVGMEALKNIFGVYSLLPGIPSNLVRILNYFIF